MKVYYVTGNIQGDAITDWMNAYYPSLKQALEAVEKTIKTAFEETWEEGEILVTYDSDVLVEYESFIPLDSAVNVCKLLNKWRSVTARKRLYKFTSTVNDAGEIKIEQEKLSR